MSRLEVFVMAVGLLNLGLVVEFVRRRKLLEGYALLWIGVALAGVVFAIARTTIDRLAHFVGISYGANLVLASAILFLLFVSMSLSLHVSRLEARTEILAEEVAFLRGVRAPDADAGASTTS